MKQNWKQELMCVYSVFDCHKIYLHTTKGIFTSYSCNKDVIECVNLE